MSSIAAHARQQVFFKKEDFAAFLDLIEEAGVRLPMRVLAWCLIPNHFHLVLWPHIDGDLSRWMQWLTTSHVRRYHRHYRSSGHVLARPVSRLFPSKKTNICGRSCAMLSENALRADLVCRAEDWLWSSAAALNGGKRAALLHPGPIPRNKDWLDWVNRPQSEAELAALRKCIERGTALRK